jgi:steroid delta-isomerase-like uncharacterized protein
MPDRELMDKREAVVRAHVDAENRHAYGETVKTFAHPRYEVVPTGDVYDGDAEVEAFLRESGVAFPDFRIEQHALHHAENAVIAEVDFVGTHLGAWRGLPPTGKPIRYRMCNVFVFEGDRLVCERLYFDLLTVLRQVGIARDPTSLVGRIATVLNHPLVTVGAAVRALRARG